MKLVSFCIFFVYCFGVVHLKCEWPDAEPENVIFRGTVTCTNSSYIPVDVRMWLMSGCDPWRESIIARGRAHNYLRELPVEFSVKNMRYNMSYHVPARLQIWYACLTEMSCQNRDDDTGLWQDRYEVPYKFNATVTLEKDEHGKDQRVHTFDAGKIILRYLHEHRW